MKKILLPILFILTLSSYCPARYLKVYILDCNSIINSVTASYLTRNIKEIEKRNDGFIIIEMDTPGGILESMRDISMAIMNTRVPVIGFVSPEGARAASAGVFIILSCDRSAMVPISHIGAAHPVNMGQKLDKTMEEKIVNDTVAFITGIAGKNKKNIVIAERMVRQSISLTAGQALKNRIIDYICPGIPDLLKKLDRQKIIKENRETVLETRNLVIVPRPMNVLERFLLAISHPNIAYILLLLGIFGILAEFSAPGIGFAGVVGGISLILAFFSLNTLPVNLTGLLLIILGAVFFILELSVQSSGILGVGAVVSLVLGSIMLIRASTGFLRISPYLIVTAGLFSVLLLILILTLGIKIQYSRPKTGKDGIIHAVGVARTDIKPRGEVFIQGELWQAKSYNNEQIDQGEEIRVVDIKSLLLIVTRNKE